MIKDISRTREFLKRNTDVVVARADKGGATMLMDRDEYERCIKDMLSDASVYRRVNKDPTLNYQKKINKFIKLLVDEKHIDEWTGKCLKVNNAVPPKIYGLRKVHKQGCKLRPVVSCINSPC